MWGSVAAGLGARFAFLLRDDGILWPDEIYQSLEPAHRLVFGYGFIAWEFLEGARSWALPGLVAGLLELARLLGLDRPDQYLLLVRAAFAVASAFVPTGVYRLAKGLGAAPLDAAVCAAASGLMGLAVYFAPRATGESLAALPLVWGLALALPRDAARRAVLAGVALVGVAVFLRLQVALFGVALLGVYAVRKDRAALAGAAGVLGAMALLYGLLDLATWGRLFHSALVYVRFNVERSAEYGREPWWFYARALLQAEGRLVLPCAVLGALAFRRAGALWAGWLLFLVAHSLMPHKELRFVYPLLPLLAALAAVGLTRVHERFPRWHTSTAVAVLAFTAMSLALLQGLTFGRLGIRDPGPPSLSALDFGGRENRLLLAAHRLPDLCGLRITSLEHWRTGGFSYLHRRVPVYGGAQRSGDEGSYNYVIARAETAPGEVVAREGDVVLARMPRQGCTPDPAYDWHLE